MRQQMTKRGITSFCLLTLEAIVLATPALGQPVTLNIGVSNGQVRLDWPAGLGVVQPQKCTNVSPRFWLVVGPPTTATSVSEPISSIRGHFYRLRFFGPSVSTYPKGATNVVGGEVLLSVAAVGTTPMTYQWRKGGVPLVGENSPTLLLNNLAIEHAGSYDVRVSNRVGGVGTPPVLVGVTNPPARPVEMYSFAGPADNGGFAVTVRPNVFGLTVGYNTSKDASESTSLGDFNSNARATKPYPVEN